MPFSFLGSLADLAYNELNYKRSYDYNELNYRRSLENQEKLFSREDTAVQRRVADLKAAGLNPLLAVGSPASSGMTSIHAGSNFSGSSDFASNLGELSDYLKNNYEAIKEQQEIAVENSRADLANKEATKRLLEAQKVESDMKALKAIADTENVNIKTRESAYNLGLFEALNIPTNSTGFSKEFAAVHSFGNLWFDRLYDLFNSGEKKSKESENKKSFEKLEHNSYNKDEVLQSFEKAKEKNKRFSH